MPEVDAGSESGSRAVWLLALGAAAGIAIAAASLLVSAESAGLPPGAVARVNSTVVRENQFGRAVEAMASDRRSPLTAADRRHVLDRLIDEELLVQYGLSLGLAERDRRVRGDLVSAVLAATVASVDGMQPETAAVRAFYAENLDFFRPPGRLRVRSLWVRAAPERSAAAAHAIAVAAVARLRTGEPFDAVDAELGDAQVAPIPNVMLPPTKLREYVGPTALRSIAALAVGEVSEPLVSDANARVFVLQGREPSRAPGFEAIEPEIRAEMRRRAGDTAVRALLDRLRAGADLEISEESL